MKRLSLFNVVLAALVLLAVGLFLAAVSAPAPVFNLGAPDLHALGALPVAAGLFKNKVLNIQPIVAANQTSVVTVPVGRNAPTLDRLRFILSGGAFTVAHISSIVGYINGREFYREGTGTVHNARRTYLGLSPNTAELVLDFTEPNARSAIEQNISSLPLAQLDSCYFELAIGAATTPAITCKAEYRAPTNNPFIKKFRKMTAAFPNTGSQTIYVPCGPKDGGKLYRIWIHEATPGNITALQLRARNAVGIDATRTELERAQASWGLTAQAGVVVLDFIEDGNLAGWFDTSVLADVQLEVTGTAADTYTVYFEYLDPIGRL